MNSGCHREDFLLLLSWGFTETGCFNVNITFYFSFIDKLAFPFTPNKFEIGGAFSYIIEDFTTISLFFFWREMVKHAILSQRELLRCLWDVFGTLLTFSVKMSHCVDRITDISSDSIANWTFIKLNINTILGFLALLVVKIRFFVIGYDTLIRFNIREFWVVVCDVRHC